MDIVTKLFIEFDDNDFTELFEFNRLLLKDFFETSEDRIVADDPSRSYGHQYEGIAELNSKYYDMLDIKSMMFYKVNDCLIQFTDNSRKNTWGYYIKLSAIDKLKEFLDNMESNQSSYQEHINKLILDKIKISIESCETLCKNQPTYVQNIDDNVVLVDGLHSIDRSICNLIINKIEFINDKPTHYQVRNWNIFGSNCGCVGIQLFIEREG